MRGRKSAFWGVMFLVAAAAILMGRFGYLEGIGFWSILFSICLIAILIKGVFRMKIGMILFSLAFLIIVNDELLNLEAITPWPVLGAALLGTIGLKILFPRLSRGRLTGHAVRIEGGDTPALWEEGLDGEDFSYENVFGSSVKYLTGVVRSVHVDNVFGSMEIYFTDACLYRGKASCSVDGVFGSVILYVPRTWQAEIKTGNVFASSGERGRNAPDGANVLHVDGDMVFGSLEVVYV